MKQQFRKGEVAMLVNPYGNPFKVKILDCIEDGGAWYYEVTPTDWEPIGVVNREVPQRALERKVEK